MINLMPCCRDVPRPKPWKAGVDDSANPDMVERMESIANRLSSKTPLPEFIRMLRGSANIDSRTMMGYRIQTCLLHNAADRLDILGNEKNPRPWASWRERAHDAWSVFRGRAVAIVVLR